MWSTPSDVHDLSDEEHFTAEHLLHYFLGSRGVSVSDIGISDVVICTFLPQTFSRIVKLCNATPAGHWLWSHDDRPLFHGTINGRPVSLSTLHVGAPGAVLSMEVMIASGARTFIVLGAAGSLQERAPIGSIVVPDAAIREDGTSFHYLAPEIEPRPNPALAAKLRTGFRDRGVDAHGGTNWSTDAIFRELKKKVQHYRTQGVLTVEMEAAAMFSVGMFRGVEVAFALAISDELFRPWAPAFREKSYRNALNTAQDVALAVAATLPVPHAS